MVQLSSGGASGRCVNGPLLRAFDLLNRRNGRKSIEPNKGLSNEFFCSVVFPGKLNRNIKRCLLVVGIIINYLPVSSLLHRANASSIKE